jgi:hypothetical protein
MFAEFAFPPQQHTQLYDYYYTTLHNNCSLSRLTADKKPVAICEAPVVAMIGGQLTCSPSIAIGHLQLRLTSRANAQS